MGLDNFASLCGQSFGTCHQQEVCDSRFFAVYLFTFYQITRCDAAIISKYAGDLVRCSGVPYVQGKHIRLSAVESVIETEFHVDHTEVDALVSNIPEWKLGHLNVGDEYFAFTFCENLKFFANKSNFLLKLIPH